MKISGQIFTGVMDTDSDPRVVSSEDYTYALNVLNGHGETPGSLVFCKGTAPYTLGLPAGTNVCIGAVEDKQNAALIIFIYNSNNNHRIYKYRFLSADHITLAAGSFLGFTELWRVNHARIVEGKLVYWTDSVTSGDVDILGNPPRKINAEKADTTKSIFEYEIYADIDTNGPFANLRTYTFSTTDVDGTNEDNINEYTADGAYASDGEGGLGWLFALLEADYNGLGILFEYCNNKIKVECPSSVGRFKLVASDDDVILVGTNIYPVQLEEHHIDLLKVPPSCAPTTEYINDPAVSTNNVDKMCAQFRVRYIYDDYEQSAWGPVSNGALNTGVDGEPISLLNAIKVTFTDSDKFTDPSWMTLIRAVDVAFRDGNDDDWKLIKRYGPEEIGLATQEIIFYNDKQYGTVPSDDLSTVSELQVLKPYDFLPIKTLTMEASANQDGNTLLFLGAGQENYDNPDCIDLTVTATEYEDDCLIDIIGTVEITNDANYASANPDFSVYPLGGIVVYLAGTPYYGISNNPADGSGDGSFIIKGVPKGHYILRAASYKCSFTNDLGPRYNMANGLEWQRTSAPVIDMAGAVANGLCQYEREIDLAAFTDPVFDLDTETGYGTVQIQNGHWTERLIWDSTLGVPQSNHPDAFVFTEIYLLDHNATIPNTDGDINSEEYADMLSAIGVERQQVTINPAGAGAPAEVFLTTDHNGYCFYGEFSPEDDSSYYPYIYAVNDNIITLAAEGPVYTGDFTNMYDETINNKWVDPLGVAGLGLLEPPVQPELFYTQFVTIFNDGNLDIVGPYQIDLNAVIEDTVTGLDGVVFTYTRTGRHAISGIDGSGSIAYYIPYDIAPDRNDDTAIALYLPDFCHDGYPDPDSALVEVTDPVTDPYVVDTFVFAIQDMNLTTGRFLKGGGEYSFGIVYEDRGNRTPGAIFGAKLKIPVHTAGLAKWQMSWEIDSVPPDWATHWRIVRLKNAIHSVYVQWTVDPLYVRIPSQLEDPIFTTYAAGDYTHLLFKLYSPLTVDPDADPALTMFFQQDGQQGYSPQIGDRVRLLLDAASAPVNTDTRTYEAEIVGLYASGADTYAIIPAVFGNLEITTGFLAEYYTPVTGETEIYWEGGEDCYEIGDAGLSTRYHKGQVQDQIIGTQPATGIYTGGDTYWRRQKYTQTGIYETEHQTPNRYLVTPCQDIGRAFALSTDIQKTFYNTRVRVSGSYIQNSAVNGLSAFAALDYKDLNRQWGTIMYLGFSHNVLLAICKFKVQPIYIGKGNLLYLSGQSNVGRSDQIMEIADESVTDYGTHNPESVVIEGSAVYFWDKFQGAVCRYAQNGVVPITTKMVKHFNALGKERIILDTNEFSVGGFDRQHQMYLLTFRGTGEVTSETIGYDELKGGWVSFYSFIPDTYGRVGQQLFSFKDGAMYLMFSSNTYSNFYSTQYTPAVTFVVNQGPRAVKRFKAIRINSNRKWECPTILVPFNYDYASGMASKLLAGHFSSYEGQWFANFLRDMNDTDKQFDGITPTATKQATAMLAGRELRGEIMTVKISAVDGSAATILTSADVYFLPSLVSHP